MNLKADIGIDELEEDCFRCIIYDIETGETFAHVFGKTAEECEERAELLANATLIN
jgi:hypothetical protein